jgi:hypothetical protein
MILLLMFTYPVGRLLIPNRISFPKQDVLANIHPKGNKKVYDNRAAKGKK